MNREIRFRAWDKDSGQMLYDVQDVYDSPYMPPKDENGKDVDKCVGQSFGDILSNPGMVVMQYTGLKDRHGKKIWEGDLIELDGYGKGKVMFSEGMFQYVPLKGSWVIEPGVTCKSFYPVTSCPVEVIGNVWETPELLK